MAITLHGNKTTFTKNLFLSVFELIIYQNAKTYDTYVWERKGHYEKRLLLPII